jgi:hypothetical protein
MRALVLLMAAVTATSLGMTVGLALYQSSATPPACVLRHFEVAPAPMPERLTLPA